MSTKITTTRIFDTDNEGNMNDADFLQYNGYKAELPDPDNQGQTIPNPESTEAFINRMMTDKYLAEVNANRYSKARTEVLDGVIIAKNADAVAVPAEPTPEVIP